VERLYDTLLALEQSNREGQHIDDEVVRSRWESKHQALVDELWTRGMWAMPVTSYVNSQHPFIALMNLQKGKRTIPRILRLLPETKVNILLGLLMARFYQMDVVRDAHVLDEVRSQGSPLWKEVSAQTDSILMALPSITSILAQSPLSLIIALLNIFLDQGSDAVLAVLRSQPGIALITAFFSRVDYLGHEQSPARLEDWELWDKSFARFLQNILGSISVLFPSQRVQPALRAGYQVPNLDLADMIAWQFLAAMAARGTQAQQMAIVAEVRDLILEIVQAVHNNWIPNPEEARLKLANVNTLLNAIGLDHTMLIAA